METNCHYEHTDHLFLFCADDSEYSINAFHWYYKHLHRPEHVVGLVHIYHLPEHVKFSKSHHHGDGNPLADLQNMEHQKDVEEALQKRAGVVHKYQELCEERNITSRVYCVEKKDTVGHMICCIAQEHNAACIVMGQRGLGAIKRTIFGSVSEHVLHHAKTSVIIVPPEKCQK